jgi:hypothetical protein
MREELRGPLRVLSLLVAVALCLTVATARAAECPADVSGPCYVSFAPPGAMGRFHYFTSQPPLTAYATPGPVAAVIGMHGHPRDAVKTLAAIRKAAESAEGADAALRTCSEVEQPYTRHASTVRIRATMGQRRDRPEAKRPNVGS